jgi:hypothetical protein
MKPPMETQTKVLNVDVIDERFYVPSLTGIVASGYTASLIIYQDNVAVYIQYVLVAIVILINVIAYRRLWKGKLA